MKKLTSILCILLLCGGFAFAQNLYTVRFTQNPNITATDITYKEFKIGEITKTELSSDGKYVYCFINISPKYHECMTSNCTFYADNGELHYSTISDEDGVPLSQKDYIDGYHSYSQFSLELTKVKLKEKEEQLSKFFKQKYLELVK